MLRDLIHAWRFSGMLSALALAGAGSIADQPVLAQTGAPSPPPGSPSPPCHLLTSAQSVPDGHGAAYNVFSAAKELLLAVECGSSSNATLTVGNGQNTTYIYRVAYEWIDGGWKEIALRGSQPTARDWYVGTAIANLSRSQAQLAEDNFVVAYTCLFHNNAWKCGCRNSNCTQNYWQLQAFKYVPPPTGGGEGGGTIPTPTRTINVSSASQLSSAVSNAQAGDHIVLANGSYSGFTVSRSGQSGKPIVIRAANTLGAKIGGNITIAGSDVWVIGMDITNGGGVTISGTRDRISSSRFRTNGKSIVVSDTGVNAVVDHNDIESKAKCNSVSWMGFYLIPHGRHDLNPYIYRNYFHDSVPYCNGGDDNSAIHLGGGGKNSKTRVGALVEYNLFQNWKGDGETISNKSSGNTYQFNTSINSTEFVNRHGQDNKWIANWIEDSQGMRIHDHGHQVIGNRGNIRIMAGDCDGFDAAACHPNVADALIAGNIGTLTLGYAFSGDNIPARNNTIEGHNGSIKRGKEKNNSISNTISRTLQQAFKLTPSQVGPNAPTAPKL
jgi:Chondroitinase B